MNYPDKDRYKTFELQRGGEIYGGFTGDETELDQRDFIANPTILNGNIGDQASAEDNAFRVVYGQNDSRLDGFKIKDVKVNGVSQGALSSYTVQDISSDFTIEFESETTGDNQNENPDPSQSGGGSGGGCFISGLM